MQTAIGPHDPSLRLANRHLVKYPIIEKLIQMLHGFPYLYKIGFQSTVSSLANLFLELVVLRDAFELGYGV